MTNDIRGQYMAYYMTGLPTTVHILHLIYFDLLIKQSLVSFNNG